MKTAVSTLTVAILAGALAAPVSAGTAQLAASAGIEPAAAQTLTLDQIAAIKFNNESAADDRQAVPAGNAIVVSGREESTPLSTAAALHFNESTSVGNHQTVVAPVPGNSSDRSHLAAVAGLEPGEADTLSLEELAKAFFSESDD
jgi:hypothetical protein